MRHIPTILLMLATLAAAVPVPAAGGGRILFKRGAEIIPAGGRPVWTGLVPGPAIRLIHLSRPVPGGFVEAMAAAGVRPLDYLPENGYAVWATPEEIRALDRATGGTIDFVRDWGAADRLHPALATGAGEREATLVLVRPDRGRVPALPAGRRLMPLAPPVSLAGLQSAVRLRAAAADLRALAVEPEVYWIEPYLRPVVADEAQGQIVAGNHDGVAPVGPGYLDWLASAGLDDLSSVVVDVTDTGCDGGTPERVAHPDLAGRITAIHDVTAEGHGRDLDGHGTINASIVGGVPPDPAADGVRDGNGYQYGLGIAPGVRLVCTRTMSGLMWAATGGYTDFVSRAYAAGARISSNSWGMPVNRADYDGGAKEYDAIVRDADRDPANGLQPIVVLFAAGNEGAEGGFIGRSEKFFSLRSPGTAKNVITVGASENYRLGGNDGCEIADVGADDAGDLINFSSRGPTGDLRYKPDLVAPGTHVQGAASTDPDYGGGGVCDRYWPVGQTRYAWSSGTSHATPAAAGAAALAFAWHRQRSGIDPSPALLKAHLAAHATDMAGGDTGFGQQIEPRPSVRQGWGRLDLSRTFDDTPRIVLDQEVLFSATGDGHRLGGLLVADPARPVRIALAWSDAPGSLPAAAWVNNLDLVVTADGGTIYRGNYMVNGVSVPTDQANGKDNLELVFLPPGTASRLTIDIVAATIAGDGVPGNDRPADQDFALYVYNAREIGGCTGDEECDDRLACTNDRCDSGSGRCLFEPDDLACDDSDPCTGDRCDPTGGCRREPLDDGACDDGLACTADDACRDGVCLGVPADCGDTVECTRDGCREPDGGCENRPDDLACDDGFPATADRCDPVAGCLHDEPGGCATPIDLDLPFDATGTLAGRPAHAVRYCALGLSLPGADAVHAVRLEAGRRLTARLRPDGFPATLLLVRECSAPEACLATADGGAGPVDLAYRAAEAGLAYLVVKALSGAGPYRLEAALDPVATDGDGPDGDAGGDGDDGDGDHDRPDGDGDPAADGEDGEREEGGGQGGCVAGGGPAGLLALLLAVLAWRNRCSART